MATVLGPNQYGKAETRLVVVRREGLAHELIDLNVSVALAGDLDDTHLTGDNAKVLPTDTQKNTVYAFARQHGVASVEAFAHANYKNKIVEIDEEGTTITRCHSGKPCRLIRNKFTDSWVGRENEIQPFPLQVMRVGFAASEKARYEGKIDEGGMPCGQGAAMITSIKPAGQIVHDVMEEARATLEERILNPWQASRHRSAAA